MLGSPQLFPVPGPKVCARAGGRLAPRGPVMTEPPRVGAVRRAGTTNINATGGRDAYFHERDDDCLIFLRGIRERPEG